MDSSPPLFFATSGPTKRRTHYFCLLFSQYWAGVEQINVLGTSPRNQFRDYHTWNRIEKLMPRLWNFSPRTLKTLNQKTNSFSNLDFWQKSGFPKTLDLSMDFPRSFHGFPTPWPGSLGRALMAVLAPILVWVFWIVDFQFSYVHFFFEKYDSEISRKN